MTTGPRCRSCDAPMEIPDPEGVPYCKFCMCPWCESEDTEFVEGSLQGGSRVFLNANMHCVECNRYFTSDEHGSRPAMVR